MQVWDRTSCHDDSTIANRILLHLSELCRPFSRAHISLYAPNAQLTPRTEQAVHPPRIYHVYHDIFPSMDSIYLQLELPTLNPQHRDIPARQRNRSPLRLRTIHVPNHITTLPRNRSARLHPLQQVPADKESEERGYRVFLGAA